MGLFDEVLGGLEAQSGQSAALYNEVAGLVTQSGGVNGLVQQFEQKGLGELANGWVGTGANPPITAQQIIQVIGQDKITEIAGRIGLSEPQVATGIAQLLPLIINHLTPNGTAPSTLGAEMENDALGLLKSKLFGA